MARQNMTRVAYYLMRGLIYKIDMLPYFMIPTRLPMTLTV